MSFTKLHSDLPVKYQRTGKMGGTIYELQTLETRVARIPSNPITRLEDWRQVCRDILDNARCYPQGIHQTLLEHCKRLVYSPPEHRRELLDKIITRLIDCEYPISSSLYNSYLSTVWALRLDIDLNQVFEDLRKLNLPLSYDNHHIVQLSDTVCNFLSLQGDSAAISQCFDSFSTSRNFPGFTDRSFGIVAAAHIMRGEFDELVKLQSALERCGSIKLGYRFYSSVMFSLARNGNLDLLDTLLRKDKMACVTGFENHLATLCIELVNSGNENFILNILPYFHGVSYQWGRVLEQLVCDHMSRGAVGVGADLLVHGGDLFKFHKPRQLDIFESETLPDIMQNITENLDNILVQLELRGVDTQYIFNFDKISDDIVHDIDRLEGEFPDSDWVQKLYDYKMNKMTKE
ncbi:uncharacterized protein LOC134813486 [Bolinopsis microptera]|uniref:uncharacterized protein LOC134813486 n=1 Tax=Bolinopsis microptera TaxID=2820187 RepID=UPI00307A8718